MDNKIFDLLNSVRLDHVKERYTGDGDPGCRDNCNACLLDYAKELIAKELAYRDELVGNLKLVRTHLVNIQDFSHWRRTITAVVERHGESSEKPY